MTGRDRTDYAGREHAPAGAGARVLSLVPSLTELMFDLGLAGRLVGRTHYCIHPAPAVADIPSVGGTKKIVMERVRELAPTHALLNVDENPKEMAEELEAAGIETVVTHPMHPDDNPALYRLIGGVFGAEDAAARMAADYDAARAAVRERAANLPARRILYLIWKDPWMGIGRDTYIANMLSLVNWHVPDVSGERYPELRLDDATLAATDLVLFSTEPYAFSGADIDAFRDARPAHAAKARLIDGEMTSWYGSRAVRSLGDLLDYARGAAT